MTFNSNRGHMVVLVTLHTQRSAITIIQNMSIVDYSQAFYENLIFCRDKSWVNCKDVYTSINIQENTFYNWYWYLVNIQQYTYLKFF